MKCILNILKKEQLQKSSLQYISHEMKSPIMIIESYAVSAKVKNLSDRNFR